MRDATHYLSKGLLEGLKTRKQSADVIQVLQALV